MSYPEFLDKLNPKQREAATQVEGPVLIIAGAGSGKTTVLINRLAYMVWSGIPAKKILLLTFTNVAADNMANRAAALANEECKNATCCTFHAFCAKVLRDYHEDAGLPVNFTIITGQDVISAINIVKSRLGYATYKKFPQTAALASAYSYARNTGCDFCKIAEQMAENTGNSDLADAIVSVMNGYQSYKMETGLADYDDLLFLTAELLENDKVRDELESQYSYVMVDEYQDTNAVQEKIAMLLTKKNRNLCVVGDDYQSIYAFRGADVKGILTFPTKVEGCKVVEVLTNYRSTSEILEIPNKMMELHADFGFKKAMKSGVGSGKYPTLCICADERKEAEAMFGWIRDKKFQGASYSEIAVLSRKSSGTALLEALLTKEGIPFVKQGGPKFFELKCVSDVLAIFKVACGKGGELAWYSVLDLLPGIGAVYAEKIVSHINTSSFPLVPELSKAGYYKELEKLAGFLSGLKHAMKTLEMKRLFELVCRYYEDVRRQKIERANVRDEGSRTEMFETLIADLEMLDVLKGIAVKCLSVSDFLDQCALDSAPVDEQEDAVVISTIHSAKGMEWDNVWVCRLFNGNIPKFDTAEDIREDLRCLYVALTRAKRDLHMSYPKEVMSMGDSAKVSISMFLEDVVNNNNTCIKEDKEKSPKVYINVPYSEKEVAKKYGARWDAGERSWFIPPVLEGERRSKLISMYG